LIVNQDVDGLVDGMTAFLDGRVRAGSFDAEAYNREAFDEFSRAIGMAGAALSRR
jgi:hypothetical protein